MRYFNLTLLAMFLSTIVTGQEPSKAELKKLVREYRKTHEHALFTELVDWLTIPNVADDQPNIRKCAAWLKEAMEKRGITTQILETGGSPVVYGELKVPGARRTVR